MIRHMPCLLSVHLLPATLDPERLPGCVAVMIDVLRASTTITHALAAGCDHVVPCREIQEARDLAARVSPTSPLLAGERGGTRIPGFDLGNSPVSENIRLSRPQIEQHINKYLSVSGELRREKRRASQQGVRFSLLDTP